MPENYGVCRLPLAPLRAEASDRSEMVSQLLFGEHYQVLDKSADNNWVLIQNYFDSYRAWLDLKQHHAITAEYYQHINSSNYQITTQLSAPIMLDGALMHLVLGSILPISLGELFQSSTLLEFKGNAKSASQKLTFAEMEKVALKYSNAPYLWGGKSPWGIDCSGYVQQVFRVCGYKTPRDAYQQEELGLLVNSVKESLPGDLAFFALNSGKVNHVGIILEQNQIIHASGKVRIDQLTDEGIINNGKITHKMYAIKRVLR